MVMANKINWISQCCCNSAHIALASLFSLMILFPMMTHAQTYAVIWNFPGGEVSGPFAGLTIDRAGDLYGTTPFFGLFNNCAGGCGTVFKLSQRGSGWIFTTIYEFQGGNDGRFPASALVFGPDGKLYGTTFAQLGTVFTLRPPSSICPSTSCPWLETVLHEFGSGNDGVLPYNTPLVFDAAGDIFGTTGSGGEYGDGGTVFELTPTPSGWTEHVLYSFSQPGGGPYDGVILDQFGNLYGTTAGGGSRNYGTVFKLTHVLSGWVQEVLHEFQGGSDGGIPIGGLTFDSAGNLYGTTSDGGSGHGGTVFELTPMPGGNWTYTVVYSFTSGTGGCASPGLFGTPGPSDTLVMDGLGNFYGTTACDGPSNMGTVFKLTPTTSLPWTYASLHDFTGRPDGNNPLGAVAFDNRGNLYGTTSLGGTNGGYGDGTVFEITAPPNSHMDMPDFQQKP